MFNSDRLNDDYERHKRHFVKDELDILVADADVIGPRWYNGLLVYFGERLISAGKAIKERNSGSHATLQSQSYGE